MKLYLSSYRIPAVDELVKLIGKSSTDTKVALIPNAGDYYAGRAREIKIQEVVNYFKNLGFKCEVVDLREFRDSEKLQKELKKYDLIWAMGGNTFILRYEMQQSGFEQIILNMLSIGKVYGGESAGALAAGNTLRGIEFADNPLFAEKVIWDGLNLIDNFVLPHIDSTDFGDAIEKAREMHKDDKTMIELKDSQAYIVNGSKTKIIEGSVE